MPSTLCPWDTWDLDRKFLDDITRWTDNHPESRLDRVLDNICTAIDAGKDFLDLIPDSPFPAGSLVQALGQLIKVGTVISKAKGDVYAFSKNIVDWVSRIAAAFKHDHSGRFTSRTWDDLGTMRDLINEICTWATKRLNDKGLKRIRHGHAIGKEIGEFKSRFTDGTQLFMQLCMVNLAQGNDALLEHAEKLAQGNDTIRKEIEPLGPAVSFIHDRAAKQELIDDITSRLSPRIAPNFSYVIQGRACCDPETRIEILGKIEEWAHDTSDDSPRLFWLTGIPGAGKSSIGASIARTFDDKNFLRAQFFISRSHPSTTDPNRIFPSIALQLAKSDRMAADAIHSTLEKQKSLANNITNDQARKLFVKPISEISDSHPSDPILVVIDALDEIEGEVGETAKILSDAIVALPRNVKVFISSRPEHGIQLHFSPLVNKKCAAHLDLDTSHPLSMQDVAKFLRSEIKKILRTYLSEMKQWPGEARMQMLCDRASGLFIWAVTAVGYIRSCIEAEGSQCLDDVLDDLNTGGKHGIDKLYSTILQRTFTSDEDGRQSEIFCRVVGAIVTLQEPLPLTGLRGLLDLHSAGRHRSIDVKHFICRFRSVLVAGTDDIDDTTVPRLHKSFVEFITTACDNRFRVNKTSSSTALAVQCFRQLNSLRRDMCEIEHMAKFNADIPDLSLRIERHLSLPFRYACRFWAIHLSRSDGREDTVRQLFRDFFYQHLLHWVEVMSLLDYNSVFSPLERAAEWEYNNHHDDEGHEMHTNDAILFVKMFSEPITKSAPHTYISALSFVPKSSWIYKHYRGVSGCTINVLRGALQEWPQYIWQSRGHGRPVLSVAFSPNGKQIVSGSYDQTICLWDAASGQRIGSPLEGHSSGVTSVAFSPDGKQIVSGSDDHTICLWDVVSGQLIGSPLKGHSSWVTSVAFSPDGKQIVSGSDDETICLWDAVSGQLTGSPLKGHSSKVTSVAFSPDGKRIVSGSWDQTICLWDAASGQLIGSPLEGHSSKVTSVAFSPDGKQIVSGSWDETICLLDAASGQLIRSPLKGHSSKVTSVTFSPDGKQIASGSYDKTICLWDAVSGQLIGSPLEGHSSKVISVAFSPDGKQIVSGSDDETICLWDAASGQLIGSPLKGHSYSVTSVAFSPDGKQIVSGSDDETICLWDAVSGQLIGSPLKGHSDPVTSVAFSPDGKQIVSGSWDQTICLWNAASGQLIGSSLKGHNDWVTSVAFSSDGKQIVSGSYDETICLWDAASGQLIGSPLKGHSDPVTSVAFTPDGKQIVSGSHDGTICLWDAASGQLVGSPLRDHIKSITSVAFSPDGKQIVSRYYDGTVHSWNLATGKIDPCQELSTDTKFGFLTVQDGWVRDARDESLLYWIPEHSWSIHVWASSGAKLVMGHSTGRVTIIDATAVFQSCRISV